MGARRRRMMVLVGVSALGVAFGIPSANAQSDPGPATVDADFHTLATPPLADGQFELLTLSTLPDTVTGGDVLVAVRGLADDAPLTVTADGRDVTDVMAVVDDGERHGLVTGLPLGPSALQATSGDAVATLEVVNHPVTGPVISGPHQEPFRCETEEAGLGAPLDDDCSIEPHVEWYYRSALDQGFHRLADPYSYPDDVTVVQPDEGGTQPFVVRIESRTINRSITRIAVLDDPAARGPDTPFEPALWNHRVYHAFGEACGVGYHQGTNSPETVLGSLNLAEISADNLLINLVGITTRLGAGDVVVHSTLTSFGVHCNPFVSIETAMMIKEYLTEAYGRIDALIGTNGSGAALQQYNAANNAPGLLSAAMPTATFADIVTTAMTVADCGLMNHYKEQTSLDWTALEWAAATGHHPLTAIEGLNDMCQSWEDTFLERLDPSASCAVPDELKYDADTNPTGVRCTIQDANVNFFGTDDRGFARRPLDNTGVQYGLEAYRSGQISLAQFVDLNEKIGGFDIDGNVVADRMVMSSELASLIYRSGGVIGRGALDETPVLDHAPYLDLIPTANIHEAIRPFVVRDRLRSHSGTDETQVIWRGLLTQADGYDTMAAWLDGIERPGYGGDHTAAVIAGRPAGLGDRCAFGTFGGRLDLPDALTLPLNLVELPLLPGLAQVLEDQLGIELDLDVPIRVDVPEDFDSGIGVCSVALPVGATPRMAAGMPRSDDVIKCQLAPLDPADYPGASVETIERLRAVFPDGVCDYSLPAAEDVDESMVWVSIGSTEVEPPHELTWRVARSVVATGAAAPVPSPVGGGQQLPATGARTLTLVVLGAAAVGLALRVRRPLR